MLRIKTHEGLTGVGSLDPRAPQNGGGWAHLSHTPVGKSVITVVMIVKLVTVMLPVI